MTVILNNKKTNSIVLQPLELKDFDTIWELINKCPKNYCWEETEGNYFTCNRLPLDKPYTSLEILVSHPLYKKVDQYTWEDDLWKPDVPQAEEDCSGYLTEHFAQRLQQSYWRYVTNQSFAQLCKDFLDKYSPPELPIKDIHGKDIKVGQVVNVYYTSSDGEHIHDSLYEVVKGPLGDIQFKFLELLWHSYGYNQYPVNTTLCLGYKVLDVEYKDGYCIPVVPNTYEHVRWTNQEIKATDYSTYFEIVGSVDTYNL